MHAWAPVTIAAAALLVATGAVKLRRPVATVVALRAVGLRRAGPRVVRGLAVLELVAGTAALAGGARGADAAVAVLYAGFTAFLLRALRRPGASCGCAGHDDTPPSVVHLVMTAVFATAAAAAAIAGGGTGAPAVARTGGVAAATALGLAVLLGWLGWVVLTVPAATASHRPAQT